MSTARWVVGIAGGAALGVVAAVVWQAALSPSPQRPAGATARQTTPVGTPAEDAANPYAQFRIADFSFTNQDGRPTDATLLDGQISVVSFFFTSCTGPCPALNARLRDLQPRLAGSAVRLVSISVDGDKDTPEAIRAYGQGFGADFSRWTFLTGPPPEVARLSRESLQYTLREDPREVLTRRDGTRMANIVHPTRLVLVGPDRRVLGLYPYEDVAAMDRLVTDALAAAKGL
jgi:protein SCO1/2